MLELDEQLRRYFDETTPTPLPRAEGGTRRQRSRRSGLLVAALVAVVAGIGTVLWLTGNDESGQIDTDTVDQPAPDPVEPDPSDPPVVTAPPGPPELEWSTAVSPVEWTDAVLVGDETGLFLIDRTDGSVHRSTDGIDWEIVVEAPDLLAGQWAWSDTDAAGGRILHLVSDGRTVHTLLIETDAALVTEVVVPFDAADPTDLRGFVALNDEGEAVVTLWDNGAGPGVPLPTAAFHSSDGRTWTPVDPAQLPEAAILSPSAARSDFLAVVNPPATKRTYWRSADGATWTELDAPDDVRGHLLEWGNTVVAYRETCCGPQALSANPTYRWSDGEWIRLLVDLDPLEGSGWYGPFLAAGDVGIASFSPVSALDEDSQTWFVEFSVDGYEWSRAEFRSRAEFPGPVSQVAATADRVVVLGAEGLWIGEVG